MLANRCFDDFAVGDRVVSRGRTVTEADVAAFANLTWDFYPLHTDEEYARSTPFGRRIAHGPMVYAFAVGLMPIDYLGDAISAFLGVSELRHLAPVYFGDTIHLEVEVAAARPSRSRPGGVVTLSYSVLTHQGTTVMTADLNFLMRAGVDGVDGSDSSAVDDEDHLRAQKGLR